MTTVALVGLGEVGRVFAEDLDARISAWDVAFDDPASRASGNARELGLSVGGPADAVAGAELVISAVTAANTVNAADAVAPHLAGGAWYLDVNSAAPERKRAAADAVERAGARYVEAAVMSPIHPRRLACPILLGGPHAAAFAEYAAPLGFSGLEVYADAVGKAAATKLCRSVVVKGVEALVTESMLAARAWGVEDRVLASLSDLFPAEWEKLAGYLIGRALRHGTRRAEEMREAAATVAATGVEPLMSEATARRQDWSARHGDAAGEEPLTRLLDALREGNADA